MNIPDVVGDLIVKKWDKQLGFVKGGIILFVFLESLILLVLEPNLLALAIKLYPKRTHEALLLLKILVLPFSFIFALLIAGCLKIFHLLSNKPHYSILQKSLTTSPFTLSTIPQSELIVSFHLKSHQVVTRIYDEYSLKFDNYIQTALNELNAKKVAQRKKEIYPATNFRLIHPPIRSESEVELHMAPINFVHFAILNDENASPSAKEYIQKQIKQTALNIHRQKHLHSDHPTINASNYHPLGIEIVILTNDGKTLLRQRGSNVMLSKMAWDVSFSGYCGEADRSDNELDLGLAVQHKLRKEIGILPADPSEIIFTGLHRNKVTGAIDMLGLWKTEATTEELVKFLTKDYPGTKRVFQTARKAEEPFVWDTKNLIVEFESIEISKAMKDGNLNLIPEALACIERGLEVTAQSASGLS